MGKRKTTEQFVQESKCVHKDKYDYSEVDYKGCTDNVKIICRIHGEFYQPPINHLVGKGCPKCGQIKKGITKTKTVLNKKFKDLGQPEEYKLIPLTQGKFAMVDNEDFDELKGINWSLSSNNYSENKTLGLMHRYIMKCPDHLEVDHVNNNRLDNRRSNLRISTRPQNMANTRSHKGSYSSHKGVSRDHSRNKWLAKIMSEGRSHHVGYFEDEEEAGMAYDRKALELFGEFAYLNFPELKQEYLKQLENIKIC